MNRNILKPLKYPKPILNQQKSLNKNKYIQTNNENKKSKTKYINNKKKQ